MPAEVVDVGKVLQYKVFGLIVKLKPVSFLKRAFYFISTGFLFFIPVNYRNRKIICIIKMLYIFISPNVLVSAWQLSAVQF